MLIMDVHKILPFVKKSSFKDEFYNILSRLQQLLMLGEMATINCIIITFWDEIGKNLSKFYNSNIFLSQLT